MIEKGYFCVSLYIIFRKVLLIQPLMLLFNIIFAYWVEFQWLIVILDILLVHLYYLYWWIWSNWFIYSCHYVVQYNYKKRIKNMSSLYQHIVFLMGLAECVQYEHFILVNVCRVFVLSCPLALPVALGLLMHSIALLGVNILQHTIYFIFSNFFYKELYSQSCQY